MKSYAAVIVLTLLSSVSASVLSTTNISTVLKTVTDQTKVTVSAAALSAIAKLGTGGAGASTLSAADTAAITACTNDARNGNTASKAGLGGGTGSAGNIIFVSAKTTLHACESAQQQIALASGKGAAASDATINLLISNVGVLNANIKAAGGKRAVPFEA